MIRKRTSLSGLWEFSIPDGPCELRMVPGSYPCVGDSIYRKTMNLTSPDTAKKLFLCFEGIAYEGTVIFNGCMLGTMLPYSHYEFDITELIREGENEFLVELSDLNAVFGPAEGWKSYSGIIREVYLEERAETYLTDVFFTYDFNQDYTTADCHIAINLNGPAEGLSLAAALHQKGRKIAVVDPTDAQTSCILECSFAYPRLWSPDTPELYELTVELLDKAGARKDSYHCQVGFKDLKVSGNHFLLNGQNLFITGVCRHDLWTDDVAFTQTDEMIETDLRMMKHMGINYVRLVHYPHDRRVVEAADRIGLLVSEEPGLWWSDLSNKEITSRALSVLEKVIYRDRNHVSVAFWLSFNECLFQEDFLRDTMAVARRCDPSRLISGANCNSPEETKLLFDKYGIDFYTMHPYGTHPSHVNGNTIEDVCRVLTGKPLIFTEWGGYYVVDNPALFAEFCQEMLRLHRQESPSLAGMCYWQWQDIPEAQRGLPACRDGILTEGLVTVDRVPKTNYYTYMHFLDELRRPPMEEPCELKLIGAGVPDGTYMPLPLPDASEDAWQKALEASRLMPGYFHKKERQMKYGPLLPRPVSAIGSLRTDLREGRPFVVSVDTPLEVPVTGSAAALWFIGQATMGKGYPIGGTRGEVYGQYLLSYADGSVQSVPLRNGYESATIFGLIGPTAFDPRAARTTRAFTLSYDKNWEIYHTGLLRLALEKTELVHICVEVTHPDYFLTLYGITLEQ